MHEFAKESPSARRRSITIGSAPANEEEAARLRRQLSAVNVCAGSLEQQLQETAAQLATAESDYAASPPTPPPRTNAWGT